MQRVEKIRLKTKRANEHIRNLESDIVIWKRDGYAIDRQIESQTGDTVFTFRIKRPLRPEWATIIGDAVHNLRTALDHTIHHAVEVSGGTITTRTGFPIAGTPEKYESEFAAKIQGIDSTAIKIIKALCPYHGGNEDFWRLHELDRIDKHRLLIPVGAANQKIILRGINDKFPATTFELPFHPNDWLCPLIDGAEIYRLKALIGSVHEDYDAKFPVEIAIAEPNIPMCDPAIPALDEMFNLVTGVINTFYLEGLLGI
jgi:hypothetical protein